MDKCVLNASLTGALTLMATARHPRVLYISADLAESLWPSHVHHMCPQVIERCGMSWACTQERPAQHGKQRVCTNMPEALLVAEGDDLHRDAQQRGCPRLLQHLSKQTWRFRSGVCIPLRLWGSGGALQPDLTAVQCPEKGPASGTPDRAVGCSAIRSSQCLALCRFAPSAISAGSCNSDIAPCCRAAPTTAALTAAMPAGQRLAKES